MRTEFKIALAVGLAVLVLVVVYFAFRGGQVEPATPSAVTPSKAPVSTIGHVDVTGDTAPTPSPVRPPTTGAPAAADGARQPVTPGYEPVAQGEEDDGDVPPAAISSRAVEPGASTTRPAIGAAGAAPAVSSRVLPGSPAAAPTIPGAAAARPALPPLTPIAAPPAAAATPSSYTVAEGDSMWGIAQKTYHDGSKWTLIRDANKGVDANRLRTGQKLTIPPLPGATASAAPTASAVKPALGTPGATSMPSAALAKPAGSPAAPAAGKPYTVQKGDNGLWSVAERVYGDGRYWTKIQRANPGVDSNALKIGQTLVIPPLDGATASAAPAAAPSPVVTVRPASPTSAPAIRTTAAASAVAPSALAPVQSPAAPRAPAADGKPLFD